MMYDVNKIYYDFCGNTYYFRDGKWQKYKQTTLDDFPSNKWSNPYITIHGGAKI